jgi:hypothetical protein
MYRKLDAARIVLTASTLQKRISERFPGAGLARVAAELEAVAREASTVSEWLARPNYALRTAVGAAIVVMVAVLLIVALQTPIGAGPHGWPDLVQGVEALVNDLVFLGLAIYFLVGFEVRRKRTRALGLLHVLRSLAHIVDMHQLTKDPERVTAQGLDTPSSPERTMTAFELTRYLDYSTEMLAIISKIAALYVQQFNDPITVNAASAVEELAVGLSRTIWQKIVILDRVLSPAQA